MPSCSIHSSALPVAQVQAFHKLNQPAVIVKARETDASLVQGVLESARSKFKQTYGTDAPTVTMADNYLPGPPSGAGSRPSRCAKLTCESKHCHHARVEP